MPAKKVECAKVFILPKEDQQMEFNPKISDDIFQSIYHVPLTEIVTPIQTIKDVNVLSFNEK